MNIHSNKIENLSIQQKELRQKIIRFQVTEKIQKLKTERSKTLHEINKEVKKEKELELKRKINEIDRLHGDTKIYKAVKVLNMKAHQKPHS